MGHQRANPAKGLKGGGVREPLCFYGTGGEGGIRTPGTAFDRTTV